MNREDWLVLIGDICLVGLYSIDPNPLFQLLWIVSGIGLIVWTAIAVATRNR